MFCCFVVWCVYHWCVETMVPFVSLGGDDFAWNGLDGFFFVTMFFGVLLVMLVGCCIPNMESTKQLYLSYKPVKQFLEEKIVEYSIEEKERKIKIKNN